jgi:Sensors of blue-light using FAD
MALFQLMYISTMTVDGLATVLGVVDTAVRNNTHDGVTGMMLYADGNIVQVLEGEKEAVERTFRKILTDPRHRGVEVLVEQEILERDFSHWSMGYQHINAAQLAGSPLLQNMFRADRKAIESRVRPGEALTLLKSFAVGSSPV